MTTADLITNIINSALTVMLIVWIVLVFRHDKILKRSQDTEELVLDAMESGIEGVKRAALAALWLRHSRYTAPEEEPPLTVKCLDCGEIAGTAENGIEDLFGIAHQHVLAKFEQVVTDVQTAEDAAANK